MIFWRVWSHGPSHFQMQTLISVWGCVCPSVRPSICPSVRPSIHPFVCRSQWSWNKEKSTFFCPVMVEQGTTGTWNMEVWLIRQVTTSISSKSNSENTISRTSTQRVASDGLTLSILFPSALRLMLAAWSNFAWVLIAQWRCQVIAWLFWLLGNFLWASTLFCAIILSWLFFFRGITLQWWFLPCAMMHTSFLSSSFNNLTASICNSRLEWTPLKIRLVRQLAHHR